LDVARTFVAEYYGDAVENIEANVEHLTLPGCSQGVTPSTGCGRKDCCQTSGSAKNDAGTAIQLPKHSFAFKPYRPGTELIYPSALSKHKLQPLRFGSAERTWLRPTTLQQLLEIKKIVPEAKLVGGSTEVQM
jgi:xanthine dehydrogenase/oxidase